MPALSPGRVGYRQRACSLRAEPGLAVSEWSATSRIIVSLLAAAAPTALYVWLVWRLDRYEREPVKLLATAFVWGALPAALVAVLAEQLLGIPLTALPDSANHLVGVGLVAPFVEEGVKGLTLAMVVRRAREEFDGVLDGIVYGSLVGLGFAMTENMLYFLSHSDDLASWGYLVFGRTVVFGLNHAMFTSLTGIGLGLSVWARSSSRARGYVLAGLVGAMGAHQLHNFFLTVGDLCLVSLLLDWSGVALVAAVIVLSWQRERRCIESHLPEEVATGVLTGPQYAALRARWPLIGIGPHALLSRGGQVERMDKALREKAVELAFRKRQLAAREDDERVRAAVVSLRAQLLIWRQRLGDESVAGRAACRVCGRPTDPEDAVCGQCGALLMDPSQVE